MTGRSYLFVPGTRPDRFEKARSSGADTVILDLEDAVSEGEKATARESVSSWLSPERPVFVRVNAATTPWFEADLEAVARPGLAGVLLPKAERQTEIGSVASCLGDAPSIVPIVETALGLWNVGEIAGSPRVERIAFGSLDFRLDLAMEGDSEELLYARSRLVTVSRAMGLLSPIDGVAVDLEDQELLENEVERARRLGFGAKLCIHPKQVQTVNRSFTPTETEIQWAKRILAAVEAYDSETMQLDGQMIDRPVIERANSIISKVSQTGVRDR